MQPVLQSETINCLATTLTAIWKLELNLWRTFECISEVIATFAPPAGDPDFARSYGGLSHTEFQNAFQHFGADVAYHRNLALTHTEEAMKLCPLDPFCNLIYGRSKWFSGDAEDGLIYGLFGGWQDSRIV